MNEQQEDGPFYILRNFRKQPAAQPFLTSKPRRQISLPPSNILTRRMQASHALGSATTSEPT